MDGHKGSCQLEAVVGDHFDGAERLDHGLFLVAGPGKLGWECCCHSLQHLRWHSEWVLVELRSAKIENLRQLEDRCIR